MSHLFSAFIFKLRKDVSFKITLFVGLGLALLMSFIYLIPELLSDTPIRVLTGEKMLVDSLSPVTNFGIALPINLVGLTVMEFQQGTIRNKIIAGYSKGKIYLSIYLTGLFYTVILYISYVGVCIAIGSIRNGFDAYGSSYSMTGFVSPEFLIRLAITSLISYISIISFTVFIATTIRNVGGCIPIIVATLMVCYITSLLLSIIYDPNASYQTFKNVFKFINPLYASCAKELIYDNNYFAYQTIDNLSLIGCVVSNLVYGFIFFISGLFIFKKRDIK